MFATAFSLTKKLLTRNRSAVVFIFNLLLMQTAQGSLMITPTRVVLDERHRSAEVTLLNNSTSAKVYRILWEEKRQTQTGAYEAIDSPSAADFIASPMLRYSPRRVTIQPAQYQKIKLRLQMPRDLADGEYRSHLLMKVIEDQADGNIDNGNGKGTSVVIYPRLSFSIPIIVRKGAVNTHSAISGLNINTDPSGKRSLLVDLVHSGDFSSFGSLHAYMKTSLDSPVRQIGQAHNIALFRELPQRRVQVPLQTPDIPNGAVVQVLYKGKDEFEGEILGKAAFRY